MATIRKHRDNGRFELDELGIPSLFKSFTVRKDAAEWGRQMEVKAMPRGSPPTKSKNLRAGSRFRPTQVRLIYRNCHPSRRTDSHS